MERILITGCNGQLGRAMNIELANDDIEIINTDVEELDITSVEDVKAFVDEKKPTIIINCAAFTNVDQCDPQIDLAYKINAIGPRNLSLAATAVGAKIIQISTDYVFAGDATNPYTEFDTPNPKSGYGYTKLQGEKFVKEFSNRYFIIRTAWLYGDGKNFVKTMLRLSETMDEINVVHDQVGSPTSTVELAKMIHALMYTDNYGIFHGTCEGVCSWAEFTSEIFKLAGKSTKVNYITTQKYKEINPNSADRPEYSVLENYMLKLTTDFMMADWKDAIKVYIDNM